LFYIFLPFKVEDPFSVLSVFVPDAPSPLHLIPLYPLKEPADTSLSTSTTLPVPKLPDLRIATSATGPSGKRYHHWSIARNAPARAKLKDRDDDDGGSSTPWPNPREMQAVDWGALAVLEGVLLEEMDKRGYGVEKIEQEKLFDIVRESMDSGTDVAPDDTQEYFSLAQAEDAAEFVAGVDNDVKVCLFLVVSSFIYRVCDSPMRPQLRPWACPLWNGLKEMFSTP
jgi:hypothetical protein